jgi:hypothetical protein
MTPCVDCTLTHPRAATHNVYFVTRNQAWTICQVKPETWARRYCRWHATVRATQLNAALRHPAAQGATN